jgi:alpha-ketoglutarate-dependent taurine dioxygenase
MNSAETGQMGEQLMAAIPDTEVPAGVRTRFLREGDSFPLVIEPAGETPDLIAWIRDNHRFLERKLIEHGAVLFHDFEVDSVERFQAISAAVHPEFVEYSEPSTPRGEYADRVYVSSEYPSDYVIQPHGELSYTFSWPMKALFYCRKTAAVGGETPVADAREVLARIPAEISAKFRDKQVSYLRNYHEDLLVPWQKAFKTEDRAGVEQHCRDNEPMTAEWLEDDRLRTRQTRQAIARHPVTGQEVWFNQAHIFHTYSLGAEVHEEMQELFGEQGCPVHATYGDGTPITTADLDAIYAAYQECAYYFPWQAGDVLLADNMLMSHGRNAFEGDREVVVCFVDPCRQFEVRSGVAVAASEVDGAAGS